ncbi:MAG: VCBS repeat-containing protein [Flavobacteriales bacterium]|nr:VCBS repeat-containing protein [Flavobacteriales bacterium]
MQRLLTLASAFVCGVAAMAQLAFTNASATLSNEASSGACVAIADMDGDGLDDIVQLDMSRHVYILYQNTDHSFVTYDYGQVENSNQWGWAMADLNNDGHKDICSGVGITNFVNITSRGVYTLTDLDGPNIFTQCMTMADFDNDGRVDVFACNDVGPSNIWMTNASGIPVYDANVMPWATPACTGTSGDMSGNYGSTATDFDNDGDIDLHISHCRQGVNDPNDCRRWDRLFVNDGNGNYADLAAEYGLENREQVWTTDFGDYDNDGDLDAFQTTHSTTLMLQENDGTGHFTDVTAGSGLEITGFFLQAKMEDMDNDGFLDILTGSEEHFFKGNGNGTFTEIQNLFPAAKNILSFAFGDLNGDGFQDVYAGYGDGYVDGDPSFPDRLWLNTPNGNHWLNVKLKGVVSNRDAVGAKVTITGPWGTQIREVHAGESYGITNSFTCHFGLGASTLVSSVTIQWPSGQVDTYNDLNADQVINVVEGICISPNVDIQLSGPAVICTGGAPLTLDAGMGSGFIYQWNTNASTPSITINSGGTYTVTVDDGTGCTGEASVTVVQDPDETPTVTVDGETTICEFDQVTLTSSEAGNYQWNNGGGTGQSATVSAAGSYTVTVQGTCGDYTSAPVVVSVLDAPDAPIAADVEILAPGTANLNATGTNVVWYDVAVGGAQVGSGNAWTTPFLNTNTSFWCADQNLYGGDLATGGRTDRSITGQYHPNSDNYLIFSANEDMVINSVKVYATGAGPRSISVVDMNGGTIASGTFEIPDGESRVQLDFAVPAGGPYGLRGNTDNPQLWRDGNGSNPTFPYALGTLGAITGTSVTGGNTLEYYYFFYDWEVQTPLTTCDGPREEVLVTVGPVGVGESSVQGFEVYPVPASDVLNISFGSIVGAVDVELIDVTGRAVLAQRMAAAPNTTFDLDGIATGEYALRVRHADGTVVRRVVVR